jgi:hypothetical protein
MKRYSGRNARAPILNRELISKVEIAFEKGRVAGSMR